MAAVATSRFSCSPPLCRRASVYGMSSQFFCFADTNGLSSAAKNVSAVRFLHKFGTSFATGSPLLIQRQFYQRNAAYKPVPIRCEKQGSGSYVWIGRLAMVGFAAAIVVEIRTGKGLLENVGLIAPLPTLALAFTAFVGVLTALFIFQSASDQN